MSSDTTDGKCRDILSNWRFTALVYGLPIVAIIGTGSPGIAPIWRMAVWSAASAVMGVACLANAIHCGRVHCYFIGPFFLAMALITLLFGSGVLPLGANGWNIISAVLLAGGIVLTCGPELVLGKYWRTT